jgi:hypothetical protein
MRCLWMDFSDFIYISHKDLHIAQITYVDYLPEMNRACMTAGWQIVTHFTEVFFLCFWKDIVLTTGLQRRVYMTGRKLSPLYPVAF